MTLKQLRYFIQTVDCGLNITAASELLFTSQPGISKQLKLLESELGIKLFLKKGKSLTSLTDAGQEVYERAKRVLNDIDEIENFAIESKGEQRGVLSIGTTHTQARYVLPDIIRKLSDKFPLIDLELHQGTSEQIDELVREKRVNCVIASGLNTFNNELLQIPIYRWSRVAIVPKSHPLAKDKRNINLEILSKHSLVTYIFSIQGQSSFLQAFESQGLTPRIAFTARDADIIKTYVRKGMGVGVVASMAIEPNDLNDLYVLDIRKLFPELTTWIGIPQSMITRTYLIDFISLLSSHLKKDDIAKIFDLDYRDEYLNKIKDLPVPEKYLFNE
jgi:LysR family cys regulon transcriptional activator